MSVILPVIRWTARLFGLAVTVVFILFMIGEFTQPHPHPPTTLQGWTGPILLSFVCLGMTLAWFKEMSGAVLSIVALFAYANHIRFHPPGPFVLILPAIPPVLFVLDWLLRRHRTLGPISGN